jgi:hypothetical protein
VVDAGRARELARSLLAEELPVRWAHTQGVAKQATTLRGLVPEHDDLLEAAAWLHDVGYAGPLATTGFHPLDGARYLRHSGAGDRLLWLLVANHSCAEIEAEARGLGEPLRAEFPVTGEFDRWLVAAVTYCDMTTGPEGEPLSVEDRVTEILSRYPVGHVVHHAIAQAAPKLRDQVREIATALASRPPG